VQWLVAYIIGGHAPAAGPPRFMSASSAHKLKQAHERLQNGDAAGARLLCEQVLKRAPRNPGALSLLGLAHLMSGAPADAVPLLAQVTALAPRDGMALEHLGLAHLMLGRYAEAERVLRQAELLPGAPASVSMRLGAALLRQRKHDEAVAKLKQALARDPHDVDCQLNLGQALARSGDAAAARHQFEAVLRLDPHHADAAFNLGVLALQGDDLASAKARFERVLEEAPGHVDALVSLGIVLQREARFDEALARLRQAIALEPANAAARNDLARTLALQGRPEQAREQYVATLAIAPDFVAAHEGLAAACFALGRIGEAVVHLRATVAAEPDNRNALAGLARALFEAGELDEAETVARRLGDLEPTSPVGWDTLANVQLVRGELEVAIATLQTGIARSGATHLMGLLAYQLRHACDWSGWQAAWDRMAPEIERSAALGSPFWLLCEPTTATQQLAYTRRWADSRFRAVAPTWTSAASESGRPRTRTRIGYLSSDFQEHAVGHLVIECLELHDRDRFEVFAYSHGPAAETPMRRRFRAACEHFTDVSREPDDVVAERIRGDALDLLVDLKGYTVGDRLAIMARRPCPVQVTWLGYPGTTGASFIDYLIADPFLVPPGMESAYSERVLRLPHCYQPNDRKRIIAEALPRAAYGLPDDAFVFCCFNQTFKITPEVFAAWMRVLASMPRSVLWLLESNGLARRNMTERAHAHGIAPDRIVFAPPLPNASHLARYRVADLSLDTYPYTSHTTLSDALWCGCPALALCGETFAARVSGSILTAAGLPDLVTCALADYEALASRLAAEPSLTREIRARVAQAHEGSVLFDTARFTRDLERLYIGLL
jgi:predicted O-linked N-acetylglucosamine transferase (SPINDLY family)